MSKRPTAKQMQAKAAQDPHLFTKNQEVSKAVTRMTDPEYTVEFDGKETYVMRNSVKLAIRRDSVGYQSNPAQFVTSSKTADMGLR